METGDDVIRKIHWRELFPWTLIFRSLAVAVRWPVLVLALLGVLLTPAGWKVSQWLLVNTEEIRTIDPPFAEFISEVGSPHKGLIESTSGESLLSVFGMRISGPQLVFARLAEPFYRMFRQYNGLRPFLYLLLGCVWTIAVWSFVGVGITRIAAMKYTRNENLDLDDSIRFARQQFPSCATALGLPLFGVFLLSILCALSGLLMTFDIGLFLVSIFYFAIIALAAVMAVILLGLAFGWPLAIAAISTEGQDSFDAMTRSYAYTFQRPLHYAFYALIAVLFGGLCWLVVARLTIGIENLSYWSTSFGANVAQADRIKEIRDPSALERASVPPANAQNSPGTPAAPSASGMLVASQRVIGFWMGLLKSVAVAFLYAQFWCMAAAIYLLLRRDLDETELDEVFVSEEERTYDLPPLATATPGGAPASVAGPGTARGEAETQAHQRDED